MTYSEKVLVMVGSMIIDRAMGMITKVELVRATMTWKQAHCWCKVMSGSLQLPCKGAREMGVLQRGHSLCGPVPTVLKEFLSGWCPGACPVPHGGSPFLHLGPSIFMATQTCKGTVCRSMCLPGQHGAPSCPLALYQPLHMESYTQVPPRCQSVWGTWVPTPWWFSQK